MPTAAAAKLADQIRSGGAMPFSSFMAAALYDAETGYYAANTARTGRAGDFYTSVSVGPVFGQLMAGQFAEVWVSLGRPAEFTVIEAGANDGRFALDVLTWARSARPEFFEALRYRIQEPSPVAEAEQRRVLAEFSDRVSHSHEPAEFGVFFANELLDAVPCRRVRRESGQWRELRVGLDDDGNFRWESHTPEDRALRRRLEKIGDHFPEGYTTEIAPAAGTMVRQAAQSLARGWWFFFDYGYALADYYAPHRTTGTLRCYRAHQAHEDPFDQIGETDITAHVDFSLAAESARGSGLDVRGFLNQSRFLTGAAQARLREMDGRAPDGDAKRWLRQFQTLTHPSHMGLSFHALALSRGLPEDAPAPSGLTFARASDADALTAVE